MSEERKPLEAETTETPVKKPWNAPVLAIASVPRDTFMGMTGSFDAFIPTALT